MYKGLGLTPPAQCSGAQDLGIVPAGGHWNDSCLLRYQRTSLFERSEFLIATCKKKKTDRLCVCPDVRQIFVLVWKKCLGFSVGYVQPVQQYEHHVVRRIARSGVSPPGARSDGHHWCQAARTAATCS